MQATSAPEVDSSHIALAARGAILDVVEQGNLDSASASRVLSALQGSMRVLPEGKYNPIVALIDRCYAAVRGERSLVVAPAIAAMEMLMAAGDLIDDIEDGECELPSDRRSVGSSLETLSLLLMFCHQALSRLRSYGVSNQRLVRAYQIVDSCGVQALRGQIRDMEFEASPLISVEESLDVSRLKSASLIKAAAQLGAVIGTDSQEEIEQIGRFGWHLGLVLQLMNDVSAVWPGERAPNKSDLRLKKKTLPIVYALNLDGTDPASSLVQRYYRVDGSEAAISEASLKMALWRCGAIHYTCIVAGKEKFEAQRIAQHLAVNLPEAAKLQALLA
jgi:geranylgeranyl pyrophosphate synthase